MRVYEKLLKMCQKEVIIAFLFTLSLCFPGYIAASQRNDNVYVSGISNGEVTA